MPLSLIFVAIGKDVHAEALRLRHDPLADVRLAVVAFPDTVSILDAIEPLAVVDLAILPRVDAFPVCFAIFMLAVIRVSIGEDLVATPVPLVLEPLALVGPAVLIDEHAEAFSLPRALAELAAVDAILVLLDAESVVFAQLLVVKLIADHFIVLNGIALVLELAVLLARGSEALLQELFQDLLGHP